MPRNLLSSSATVPSSRHEQYGQNQRMIDRDEAMQKPAPHYLWTCPTTYLNDKVPF